MSSTTAGTRRFETILEIHREPGFLAEAPIDVESYETLLGWYSFGDEALKCCVATPSGGLCETEHKKGWVARRKDRVVTLIGGHCAKEKFAAGSIALQDINRAQNELDRLTREARLRELLTDRNAKLAEIDAVYGDLKSLHQRLQLLATQIGAPVWSRVQQQGLSGSTQVTVPGYTPAVRDEHGDVVSPRRDARVTVGSLPGVRACAPDRIKRELLALSDLRRSYTAELPEEGPKRSAAVKALTAALNDHAQRIDQAKRLLADGATFEAADLTPLVFFSRDPGTRIKLGQLARQRTGSAAARSAMKEWLQARDRELAVAHGVSKLLL